MSTKKALSSCFRFVECVYQEWKTRGKPVDLDDYEILAMVDQCELWANEKYGCQVFNKPVEECQRIAKEALDVYFV